MVRLEHLEDAIYFDKGLVWPPHECVPGGCQHTTSVPLAVCTHVDAERGVVTFDSPVTRRACDQPWPLQPCEVGK